MIPMKLKHYFFKLIRPLFVSNIDPNEDFNCMICNEPVLKRYLTCDNEFCIEQCNKLCGYDIE
jgi:hypothetical protein